MKPIEIEKAILRFAGLCARSEQCSADILRKARLAGLGSSDCKILIDYLSDHAFLDDARFAGAFARDKASFAAWGPYKIQLALRSKSIPDNIIDSALHSVDPDIFYENIRKIIRAKSRSLNLKDPKDKQRLLRHLAAKGYNIDIIRRAIKKS